MAMNSTKSKKKSKSALIPKPIKIKREDDHIMYPMEHYVDDRVELIRQIFASLKPKTITNLAPDFLKKSKLEDIQEQCLNEVLGISKKRLLSIINSTKCPTDTDTSGEEDIHIEEHISLEEISSDSDIADHKTSKAPKENEKQFSVLELLELQARARAIRSQLALEPVTKIEVDTDSEDDKPQPKPKSSADPASRKKPASVSNGSTSSKTDSGKRPATTSKPPSKPNSEPAQSASTKRIKLKRNFRKQVQNDDSNDEEKSSEKAPDSGPQVVPKKEARSPSPDVIPIIPVPETLCISDSDEEQLSKMNPVKEAEPTKVAEPAKSVQILSVVEIKATSKPVDTTATSVDKSDERKEEKEKKEVEPEEGEILDDEETTEKSPATETSQMEPDGDKDKATPAPKDLEESECKEGPARKDGQDQEKAVVDEPQRVDNSDSGDDSNDDVISLEGGDLLNEMKEHLDDEAEELGKGNKSAEDVICLDDSSDEEVKPKKNTESWNERWLKSSKVSKVLAASRLGNRVRNKIKESKKAKKLEEAAECELEQKKAQESVFTSKHEDGSVEQYKEIQDSIPRRTD